MIRPSTGVLYPSERNAMTDDETLADICDAVLSPEDAREHREAWEALMLLCEIRGYDPSDLLEMGERQ